MEVKKYPNKDIYKMSGLFFNIGLVISLAIVFGVFQIKFDDNGKNSDSIKDMKPTEEILEIPPTTQPPPPPPKLNLPQVIEASNEEVLIEDIPTIDLEMQEATVIDELIYQDDFTLEDENVDEVFMIVEQQASPIGGVEAFYNYVAYQLKDHYPKHAARMNIEGVVFVQFIIEKDGSITDVKAVKGIGAGCDELAMRVIEGSPKWNPGKQRGRAVRSMRVVPIRFKIITR